MKGRAAKSCCSGVGLLCLLLLVLPDAACNSLVHEPRANSGQSDCYTCHRVEYEATSRPPHVGMCGATGYVFPTTCGDCHDKYAMDWPPATTDHAWWPLTGAHANVSGACEVCHGGSGSADAGSGSDANWACLSNACLSCHLAEYQSESPHPGDGVVSTQCQDCHSTSNWQPEHPEQAFPIQSGPHGGIACADCHDTSLGAWSNGENTDCIGCHTGQHTLTRMDSVHGEVSRYFTLRSNPGGPHFCLECHPDGRNHGD